MGVLSPIVIFYQFDPICLFTFLSQFFPFPFPFVDPIGFFPSLGQLFLSFFLWSFDSIGFFPSLGHIFLHFFFFSFDPVRLFLFFRSNLKKIKGADEVKVCTFCFLCILRKDIMQTDFRSGILRLRAGCSQGLRWERRCT